MPKGMGYKQRSDREILRRLGCPGGPLALLVFQDLGRLAGRGGEVFIEGRYRGRRKVGGQHNGYPVTLQCGQGRHNDVSRAAVSHEFLLIFLR